MLPCVAAGIECRLLVKSESHRGAPGESVYFVEIEPYQLCTANTRKGSRAGTYTLGVYLPLYIHGCICVYAWLYMCV